jgi:hypothetical protein
MSLRISRSYKSIALLSSATMLTLVLSGCAPTVYNRTGMIKKEIQAVTLKNGTVMKAGFVKPKSTWGCTKVAKTAHDWGISDQMEGLGHVNGAFGALQSQAVNYANKHPKAGINYVYMFVPNQHSIMGVDIDTLKNAYNTFYHCAHPPAKMTNFFKML